MDAPEYPKIKTLFKRQPEKPHRLTQEYALPEFAALEEVTFVATEKIDGTNVRVHWDGHEVHFGGRTDRAQMPLHLLEALNAQFGGEAGAQLFEQTFGSDPITLYGEGFGPKIQKGGGNYGDKPMFALFDVRAGDLWLERENVHDIAGSLGISRVPEVWSGALWEARPALRSLTTQQLRSAWGTAEIEGWVLRPVIELHHRRRGRIITKLKVSDLADLADA